MSEPSLKVARYAFSNRSITLYPFGTSFQPSYPSIAISLPTGSGPDIDIFAETIQIHAGSKYELYERNVAIHARRVIILDAISAGAPSGKVIFDLSGAEGGAHPAAAANGDRGPDGWAQEDYHVLTWDYNCGRPSSGHDGQNGAQGKPGSNGGKFVIMGEIICPQNVVFEIRCNGGKGGVGQAGGNGGDGGNGARPGDMRSSIEDAGCVGVTDGAPGGSGGWGGAGGTPGHGGEIVFINHGSPRTLRLEDIMPPDPTTDSSWGNYTVETFTEVNMSLSVEPGASGEGGPGGQPGKGGTHGRWEHIVFIGTTRGMDGRDGSMGSVGSSLGPSKSPQAGNIVTFANKVGNIYMDQYRSWKTLYDPLWLASVAKRLIFEVQIIFAMTGLEFLDNDTVLHRVNEIPNTIRWLSAFYECWTEQPITEVKAMHYTKEAWENARQIFIGVMNELLDMKSRKLLEPSDMFGEPYNFIPMPNVDINSLKRAVADLETLSSMQNDWNSVVRRQQVEDGAAKKMLEGARSTVDRFANQSKEAVRLVNSKIDGLKTAKKAVEDKRKSAIDELTRLYDSGIPAPFGKGKALKIAEALGTVFMFVEPEFALTKKAVAKMAGAVLSMGTAGLTGSEVMSTPSGDFDPQFVRGELQSVGQDTGNDLEKLGEAIIGATAANAPLSTTIGVDKSQFYALCNKFFDANLSVHAKQLFTEYTKAGQFFNEQVIAYNKAIREQIKLSIDLINAKTMIGDISLSSEHLDADAALMSGLLSMLQSMQQREVLFIFNSVVKALQALRLKPTMIVDQFLGINSWDNLFVLDAHQRTAASTLPSQVATEIRNFKQAWNGDRPTRTRLTITLTPKTHPALFKYPELQPFPYDLNWEELAEHVSPTFSDLYEIRFRDAWVYLVGAFDKNPEKNAVGVTVRLGGNFDIGDKSGNIHSFQTDTVTFPSHYTWAWVEQPDGKPKKYTVVPITQAENPKLFFANLGTEANDEAFPIQGIVRQWELSWESSIDVSKVSQSVQRFLSSRCKLTDPLWSL